MSKKTHQLDPSWPTMTLCGRRWIRSTMELIESNHERPTCQHCIHYWERHRQGSITVPTMTSERKTHARLPTASYTLCGKAVEAATVALAGTTDPPTCGHCLKALGKDHSPMEAPEGHETPTGFALRHAVVREGSSLPCNARDIIYAQQSSFTTSDKVIHALHIWWWGLDPND
jgi:hypothetical protein